MIENQLISIVVPVFKVENEINRCVESLINQTYKNLEIILVDDGSPDNCPEICDNYSKVDNRIIVIHKTNGGLSDARNYGLRKATGKYVLFVDSDDYIEINACEELLKFVRDDVDIIIGACKEIANDRMSYQRHSNLEVGIVYNSRDYIIKSIQTNEWFAPAWLNLYKREFLLNNKLFYKTGFLFEDMEMLPRLFLKAKRVIYTDVLFYNYVIREGSIIKSSITIQKKEMILSILHDWLLSFSSLNDEELKKWMLGALVKQYLYAARMNEIYGWQIQGLSFKNAFKWALGLKEKFKVLLFSVFPKLYVSLK